VVSGELSGPDVEVEGASIDSRELRGGELFVPIVGERDGHDFIDDAMGSGAAAHLTARRATSGSAVIVEDAMVALTALGAASRDRLPDRVVGITGSVGKTTAKDLAASALSQQLRTQASVRSFNNELGVPLTLVNAPDDSEAVVVEMGARGAGHIRELCTIARPTIGVVTAVERVHTELFGDVAGVAAAKAELVEALPASGSAILNADQPLVLAMAERTEATVLLFGIEQGEVRAESLRVDDDLRPVFDLRTPWGSGQVHLALRGAHNVANALAAAAVALVSDVPVDAVIAGLEGATGSPWRMELHRTRTGALVVNDAYNAGPASVAAALRALAHLDAERRIAVLGPMAELGDHREEEHARIGRLADELDVEIISVGAPEYGADDVGDVEQALAALGSIGSGDAVLVKGSRVAGLEELAARLVD
jgi:UDP-N-acetylmuramoyl-tripeptide--D-alanyl-D-alanine ligase